MSVKSIVKSFISTRWRLVFSLSILILFSIAIKITSPLFVRFIIDRFIIATIDPAITVANPERLILWTSILGGLTVASFIFDARRIAKAHVFGNDLTIALGKEMYTTILRSELLEFKKLDPEAIVGKLTSATSKIGNDYFAKNIIGSIYSLLIVLSILITLLVISPWFGLITLVMLPIFFVATNEVTKLIVKREEKYKLATAEHARLTKESINQIKNIKVLNGIVLEEERYNQHIKKVELTHRKYYGLSTINSNLISEVIIGFVLVAILGIGGWFVMQQTGTVTLGTIAASIILVPRVFPAFRQLMDAQVLPHHIKNEVAQVNELLDLKPENRADTVQQLDEIYSLKFKDVYYEYGVNTKFELEDINFEVKKGEKLGILGLSHSGKTTLFDLMTKIIRPRQGNVLINNCDLNKVNTYYLRELISAVPQNYQLFTDTIERNITYPLAFDEYQYNDALNKCRLKSLIYGLEKKDKTIISEDSQLLTPLEKQKIALANAIYKDAKIFILDDATSKMDHVMETDIINEVYKLKNKIIIVISNRIYNLMKCDKIMILNNGRVIEYGKTKELINDQKSTFARMMKEYENSKSRVG